MKLHRINYETKRMTRLKIVTQIIFDKFTRFTISFLIPTHKYWLYYLAK